MLRATVLCVSWPILARMTSAVAQNKRNCATVYVRCPHARCENIPNIAKRICMVNRNVRVCGEVVPKYDAIDKLAPLRKASSKHVCYLITPISMLAHVLV